jgi:hypothetical protein
MSEKLAVEEMGNNAFTTLGLYFDKKTSKYVQVKLKFDPDTEKCVVLANKPLTGQKQLSIMKTATIDLVKIFDRELK